MNTAASLPDYAELRCLSNFSFLRGASHPEELVERAKTLGYAALAVVDECSLAGIVRAHVAAKQHKFRLLVGSQFRVQCDAPFTLVVLPCKLNGYGNLCEFITRLRRRAPKGTYHLTQADIDAEALADCVVIAVPDPRSEQAPMDCIARWLLQHFRGRCWLGVEQLRQLDDEMRLYRLRQSSELTAVPLVAVGDVRMHVRSRKPLHDVLTATRIGKPLTECGFALEPSAEQYLRSRLTLAWLYPEDVLAQTLTVMARCDFSLDELRYQYPSEVVPEGQTPQSHLRRLTEEGARKKWPQGLSEKISKQIEHELELIADKKYEHYFLTVHDIVAFARSKNILCQGRGSAANSVVCYCLGITAVNPDLTGLLFERFISRERDEPPDIDVDFEHERREEVIQYLYEKYGRERAALTATVISYRPRSALRDVGKALGFEEGALGVLAKQSRWWDGHGIAPERLVEAGLDPDRLKVRQLLEHTSTLMGFPRHLSQHTGGFVLTQLPLSRLVPIENATMKDRTVIEWDKDDLDAVGLLKVDVLALGMLTALRKAMVLIGEKEGRTFTMEDATQDDGPTYDMICAADTVGVFQIESRAQMSMLPRLRPREYYDLVIEVALVRPGPIQGGAVHPYLNRRQGKEEETYPGPDGGKALKKALGRTMGVPIFQEQCMQIAMLAAGFTNGEADELRRAMAAWKRHGNLQKYEKRLVDGMTARGYELAFAQSVFEQIKGFSSYGFPESHAASFALLVYVSAWIKCHHPAEFLTALLNSQPMGFYTPSQLVQDAKRHGVTVHPVDVRYSGWDSAIEERPHASEVPCSLSRSRERVGVRARQPTQPIVRLGLHLVSGIRQEAAERIQQARAQQPFQSAQDLARRARLDQTQMKALAAADALVGLSGHRRQQVWDAAALRAAPALLRHAPVDEAPWALPEAPEGEAIVWDYASTGLTLRRHPLALLRDELKKRRLMTAEELRSAPNGRLVRHCGIVTLRQQPGTSSGVVFVSLEDETGVVQVIVWRQLRERQRAVLTGSRLLAVRGVWQREGEVSNLIAGHLEDLTPLLNGLSTVSRDFH
ncbi:error-prone DNA polymerase [Hydrogenophaga sp. BPS33]|uniref:error-prone DNA polymerase n=1 Tax=Hydrogenophaga sp. BPS33 TaxID=2651974 RepID=UPI0013201D74|nr:error-prone DNA polymerase [Hydrogenophaga sp. BPS33]QHE86562.1 error-prone DNA polymerase [Hydrogenophaga sp. BPS33]